MASGSLTPDPGSVQIVPDPGSIQPASSPDPAPLWHKAQRTTNPKVIDLLTRLGQASEAGILRGPGTGFHTLLHSEAPEQYQADTSEITRRMMGATPEEYAKLNPARRGANEFATSMLADPLTILDPLLGGLSRKAATHAMPTIMRASEAAAKKGVPGAKLAAALGGGAHDFFTAGGANAAHALREEALRNGPEGVENYRRLYSLRGAADAQTADITNTLSQGFRRAIQGLSSDDRLSIYRAIHNGTIDKLPDNLKNAAQQVVAYDRSIPYLTGSKSLRTQMEKNGYSLPKDMQRFDIGNEFMPKNARGIVRASQFRKNHIPLPHEATPEELAALENKYAKKYASAKKDATDTRNLQFLRRRPQDPDSAHMPIEDAELIEDLFHSSFRRAGKSIAAKDLQQRVADLFGTPRQLNIRLGTVTPEDLAKGGVLRKDNPAAMDFTRRGPKNEPDLFRWQTTAGVPEQSFRGGTFYSKTNDEAYKNGTHIGIGGPEQISMKSAAKNPLTLEGEYPFPSTEAILKMRPGKPTAKNLFTAKMFNIEGDAQKNAPRYLRALGVPESDISKIMEMGGTAVGDRVAAELARRAGYDAIENPREFFALNNEAVRPAPSVVPPSKTLSKTAKRFADVPAHIKNFFVEPAKKMPEGRAGEILDALAPYAEGAKGLSDISRSTNFTTPFPHQARILSLLALHAPEAIPSAIAKYLKTGLGFAGPETQERVFGAARHQGATGLPNVEQSRLQNVLSKGGKVGKAASAYYGGVGKMLWGFDNAAKAALYERNLKQYGDPLLAAYHTQQSLVNYERPSPFISASRTVESFPTWRARMPAAVLKGIAEHPRNAAAIARLLGGAGFGASFEMGGKERKTSASAPGEAAQILDDPRAYARGSLSPTGKLAAAALASLLNHGSTGNPGYWIYDKNPAEFVGNSLPVVNQVAPLLGGGMFKTTPQDQLLFDLLGISSVEPATRSRHRRRHARR